MEKIGLGGSCHWCTEAIFQSLSGVKLVSQGWIRTDDGLADYSEAVIVEFDSNMISLENLIEIHLHTHSCTSQHTLRSKYRSAIYTFDEKQVIQAKAAIDHFQADFEKPIITAVISFKSFKLNTEKYLNYYYKDPGKPFCKAFIDPKLALLMRRFSEHMDAGKMNLEVLHLPDDH